MAAQSRARPPLQHTTARHQHPLFSEIIQPLNPQNTQKTSILARKIAQSLHSFTKSRTFAPQLRTRGARLKMLKQTLGYGVMVTQQILVLFFLVRVRVSQQKKRLHSGVSFFCLFTIYPSLLSDADILPA